MNEILKGTKNREKNDFYATDPSHVVEILDLLNLPNNLNVLEPCAGNGHIAEVLKERFKSVETNDLIQRDYVIDNNIDFLEYNEDVKFDLILTNPPFKLAKEFILKSLKISPKVVIFGRIQLLEGQSRKELNNKHLSEVYVYSKRAKVSKGGTDEGFLQSSSMCYAWFIYEKNKNKDITLKII